MRILSWSVIGIGFILCGSLVMAAPGLELNKATIAQDWTEGEATESILHLNAGGDWDWLRLGLSGKLFIEPVEDHYSSLDAKLVLPRLNEDLAFKAGYDWNGKYKIYDAGINYSCQPLEQIALQLGYQAEERRPELVTGCPYRLNNELIAFTWEQKPWEYRFKVTRNDKDYQEDPQYTSLKYRLEEEINWRLWPNMLLRLEYNESTGDYPAASYKDYWKEEWVVKGEYGSRSKWQYGLEYSKLYWERGFEPYRYSQKVRFNIWTKLDPATKLTFVAVYRDLDYYSAAPDYSEPGVYQQTETDLKSRVESRIGLEFQFKFLSYNWEIGTFFGDNNYDSDLVSDNRRLGIYGAFVWKLQQVEFSIKAAPVGNLSNQDAHYQIEIVYKPR